MTSGRRRICPGCSSAMQAFFVAGVEGLEIDRCHFCGGIWLDGGELEQVLGHAVEVELLEGTTRRRCASCTVTLEPVELHGVSAERCGLCHSLYLDDGELEELATGPVRLQESKGQTGSPDSAGSAGAEQITYRCEGCGTRGDIGSSYATIQGLACSLCVSMLDATPSTLPAAHHRTGWRIGYGRHRRLDLVGIIATAISLFR